MLPHSWKPKYPQEPVRLGRGHDGGYVVPAGMLNDSCVLVSMGLESDWTFEADFIARTGGRVICFDHTVDARFWFLYTLKRLLRLQWRSLFKYLSYRRFFADRKAEHRKIKIGYDVPGSVSLDAIMHELADESSHILLKIDIEGSEYRILDQILRHTQRLAGVVIELHDIDLHRDRITEFIAALDGFKPVWVHGNNFGGVDPDGDPIVVEMTFAPERFLGDRPVPSTLTRPNDPRDRELELRFSTA